MLRVRIIVWGISLFLFASWLFSEEIEPSDLMGAIKSIEATLHQLQKEINDLHGSVKELSQAGRKKQNRRPGDSPVSPDAPGAVSNWQLAHDVYERGRRAEELKEYDAAIEAFTRVIELDPKNDSALLHRGYCHYDLGDYASAIADLNQSLALQPNNSRAYAKRAAALSGAGQTAAAILDANEAIQRDGRNPANYLLRASLNQQLGKADEALGDYNKAIERAPNSDAAYLARAAFYRSQGQPQKSLEDCYQAIQLNSADAAAYLCRAQFYLSTGAAQPALEDISHAILVGHNTNEAMAMLGSAQSMLQSGEGVSKQASQSGLLASSSLAVPHAAAREQSTQGPPSTAPAIVEKARIQPIVQRSRPVSPPTEPHASTDPQASKDRADFYHTGRSYVDQQKFEEAIAAFNEALRRDPNNSLARNARGYAYLRLHQYREAIADFNEALRLNPNYTNAARNRAVAMESAGGAASSR